MSKKYDYILIFQALGRPGRSAATGVVGMDIYTHTKPQKVIPVCHGHIIIFHLCNAREMFGKHCLKQTI